MSKRVIYLLVCCFSLPVLVLLLSAWMNLDGHRVDLDNVLSGMSATHLLGCDALGRDVLARLAEGLRLSLFVGVVVVSLGACFGITLGMLSAWYGGWVDICLMRMADVLLSFPGILLAIALAAMLGSGVDNLILALVVVGWVGFARLSRVQVLSLKHASFVEAARVNGMPLPYIMIRHLLPNIAAPLLVEASFGLAAVMISEAGLSFLGIGVQPPNASLGTMIKEGTSLMLVQPSLVVFPGLMLFLIVMAVNLLGDALRDHLDVKHT
ncbi:MAG: ABC transporter permease [Mariprofundaceae bacterium]|nr:ABC transporter permease [Mariprofundaceae bacterium]